MYVCVCVSRRGRKGDLYERGEIAAGEIIRTSYGGASIKEEQKRERKKKRKRERERKRATVSKQCNHAAVESTNKGERMLFFVFELTTLKH